MMLLTPKEAAERLHVSTKTLMGFVDDGNLQYRNMGRGKIKRRIAFTEADIDAFIASRAQRDVPCRSTRPKSPRSTNMTSNSKIVGFTALQNARLAEKQRNLKR